MKDRIEQAIKQAEQDLKETQHSQLITTQFDVVAERIATLKEVLMWLPEPTLTPSEHPHH